MIEPRSNRVQITLGNAREVGSSGDVLTQQAVGVLIGAALDPDLGGNREAFVGMHLLALILGQGAPQLLRQLAYVFGKRSNNSRRILAGECALIS